MERYRFIFLNKPFEKDRNISNHKVLRNFVRVFPASTGTMFDLTVFFVG